MNDNNFLWFIFIALFTKEGIFKLLLNVNGVLLTIAGSSLFSLFGSFSIVSGFCYMTGSNTLSMTFTIKLIDLMNSFSLCFFDCFLFFFIRDVELFTIWTLFLFIRSFLETAFGSSSVKTRLVDLPLTLMGVLNFFSNLRFFRLWLEDFRWVSDSSRIGSMDYLNDSFGPNSSPSVRI